MEHGRGDSGSPVQPSDSLRPDASLTSVGTISGASPKTTQELEAIEINQAGETSGPIVESPKSEMAGRPPSSVADQAGSLQATYLECSICLQLLCQPVTTPCGHTFCRVCLVSTLRKTRKKCPQCRTVCHIQAETHAESVVLGNIARNCFPEMYQARLDEAEKEKEGWDMILPIFFFNDTLFPCSPLALHLFEPRYKVMVGRIVQASRKFAYLPCFDSYEAHVGDVGVIAELSDVEILPDGRAHLQAVCRDRYRILEHWIEDGTQGLHWCKVELLDDEAEESESEELIALASECCNLFDSMLQRFGGALSEIENSHGARPSEPQKLSFWLASVLPISYASKQPMLTSTSTKQRLTTTKELMLESISNSERAEAPDEDAEADSPDEDFVAAD